MDSTRTLSRAALILLAGISACAPPDAGRPDQLARSYLAIVAAEDARPAGGQDLHLLTSATRSAHPFLRQAGVRALGRLESPALVDSIVPLLDDPDAEVRAEAANALAQAVHRRDGKVALAPLLTRVGLEENPEVRGILARSLGRLDLSATDRSTVVRTLVALGRDAPPEQTVGMALGLESLTRLENGGSLDRSAVDHLVELTSYGLLERLQTETMGRIRTLALQALHNAGLLTVYQVEAALRDPMAGVRRTAAAHIDVAPSSTRPELIRRALLDESARVRTEAVRALAAAARDETVCARLVTVATREEDPGVRVLALDALARPCPDGDAQVEALTRAVSSLGPEAPLDWHVPAHALASLAALEPALARGLMPPFVAHDNPFVRAWAVRAAERSGNTETLRTLLGDPSPNVRAAAAPALQGLMGSAAEADLVGLLAAADDPQLILVLTELLRDAADPAAAADAATTTLERVSRAGRLTDRDARVALVELIAHHGDDSRVEELEPYLRDQDPAVARSAASALLAWTRDRWIAAPRRGAGLPIPTPAQLRSMERSVVVLHMARGGAIRIALSPWVAPTNAFRFYSMAREGTLDGRTFHRWVPNFVIQGGSPGANEYAGHGAHTRDEVGLAAQWRGTVGVSTRGRDTGDGQIYVNLEDNVRLDHDYTIFGRVTEGMGVVDQVMEGDVILRAEVRTEP